MSLPFLKCDYPMQLMPLLPHEKLHTRLLSALEPLLHEQEPAVCTFSVVNSPKSDAVAFTDRRIVYAMNWPGGDEENPSEFHFFHYKDTCNLAVATNGFYKSETGITLILVTGHKLRMVFSSGCGEEVRNVLCLLAEYM